MKCEGCPLNPFELVAFMPKDWCPTAKIPQDDCHLQPSDMTAIKGVIAGEGRLFILTPSEAHMVGEYRWNLQVARDKWERGQDQGGE